jgi:hypothetical protein
MSDPLDTLLSSIKDQTLNIKEQNKNQKKKEVTSDRNKCQAGAKFNTLKDVYQSIENKEEVFLIEDSKTKKKYAYSRCCKTAHNGEEYCHTHNGKKTTKNFERDILPLGVKPELTDDFFDGMGKRGAKKKNISNAHYFKDKNDDILYILTHKNPKLLKKLKFYANEIRKNENEIIIGEEPLLKEKIPNIDQPEQVKNIGSYLDLLSTLQKEEVLPSEEDIFADKSDAEDSEEEDAEDAEDAVDAEDAEDDDASENESDSGVSCIQIETLKGKILWLNQENNCIYEPEGDDEGKELGILKKIKKKNATILYKDDYYTVIEERDHEKKGEIYRCVLSNNLFDKKMNLIGTLEHLRNNEYRYNFTDK